MSQVINITEPLICPGCGILQEEGESNCGTCDAAYSSSPRQAIAQPKKGFWVAVRATFTCSACRFNSPLNHMEEDDNGIICSNCGISQMYSGSWKELVEHAQLVGDFGSGGPQGRFPADVEIAMPKEYINLNTRKKSARSKPKHRDSDLRPDCWVRTEERKRFQLSVGLGNKPSGYVATVGNPLCTGCSSPLIVDETKIRKF